MGRKKLNRERLHISLPAGVPDELDKAAQERGLERSRLIETLILEFLAKRAAEKEAAKGKKKTPPAS